MKLVTIEDLKKLAEQATLISKSGHPFLDSRWETEGADGRNHCYRRQYYRFNQLLVKELKPDLVVELGIDEGVSCGHFASGNPSTTVIGVDIHKDGEAPSVKCREVAAVFPNFKYIRKWTWNAVNDIKAINKPIDILYIDSWHELDYLLRDWNDYHQFLYNGSIILIDDLQMGGVSTGYNMLPYPKFVVSEWNSAVPFGVLVYDGKPITFPHKTMEFMPEWTSKP